MPLRRRHHRWIFAGLVVALLVLHVDVWNLGTGGALIFGVLPHDLAYHLGWMLAAWGVVVYMTIKVWPEEP
ncbi:MAG: hypothetical protein H6710_05130 [Myxococcales bacterium]|nr:hypothetical protein [Myxococcales bacterium]MCB9705565.1 hypothetical protein [Myxococcales bacterium]